MNINNQFLDFSILITQYHNNDWMRDGRDRFKSILIVYSGYNNQPCFIKKITLAKISLNVLFPLVPRLIYIYIYMYKIMNINGAVAAKYNISNNGLYLLRRSIFIYTIYINRTPVTTYILCNI